MSQTCSLVIMFAVVLLRVSVSFFVKLWEWCTRCGLVSVNRQVISRLIRERAASRASRYTFSGEQELPDEQGSLFFVSGKFFVSVERMQIKDKVSLTRAFETSFQC